MSEKFLQALAEDPKLEKQIGCMTGLLQIFDRQQHLTGKRLGHKKISSKAVQTLLPPSLVSHGTDGDRHDKFHTSINGAENTIERLSQPKPSVGSSSVSCIHEKAPVKAAPSSKAFAKSSPNSKDSCTALHVSTDVGKPPFFCKDQEVAGKDCIGDFVQMNPSKFLCPRCEQGRMPFSAHDESSLQSTELKNVEKYFCEKCRLHGVWEAAQSYNDLKKDSQDPERSTKSSKSKDDKKAMSSSPMKHPNAAKPAEHSSETTSVLKSKDQSMSYADLKESLKVLTKLKDAPWNIARGKVGTRSLVDSQEGSRQSSLKEPPRFSYDGRDPPRSSFEFKDSLRASQRTKESPRFSLDGMEPPKSYMEFKNSLRSHSYKDNFRSFSDGKNSPRIPSDSINQSQVPKGCVTASFKDSIVESKMRSPSVVARLMGLEEIPDKVLLCPSSTPTKPSTEAKLLQGLLDYTPVYKQDNQGADGPSRTNVVDTKRELWRRKFQPSKQLSTAADLLQPEKPIHSRNFREKYTCKQRHAAQLQFPAMQSSRGFPRVFLGVWPHQDIVLKPLSAPRYVMETMPPQHKFKALFQQKPVGDISANMPKSSKATRIMINSHALFDEEIDKPFRPLQHGGVLKQQKTLEEVLEAMQLKGLLHPELVKARENARKADKPRMETTAKQAQLLNRFTVRKQGYERLGEPDSDNPHGSKMTKNYEEQVDGVFKIYSPANCRPKRMHTNKQQLDYSSNALKLSRRIVKRISSAESSPAREFSGGQSGSSSKSSPRNACKEADSPRGISTKSVAGRPSKPQKTVEFPQAGENRCESQLQCRKMLVNGAKIDFMPTHAAQSAQADDLEGILRSKSGKSSPKCNLPHSPGMKLNSRPGPQFSSSRKTLAGNSSLESRSGCLSRGVTQNDYRAFGFMKSIQDKVTGIESNLGSMSDMQPIESILPHRSNSDVEMPSLESYESENQDSEGDVTSHHNFDSLSLERNDRTANYNCIESEMQTGAGATTSGETLPNYLHQEDIFEDSWMTASKFSKEELFAVHKMDGKELLQSGEVAIKGRWLEQIPISDPKPAAVLPSEAERFTRLAHDQSCGGLAISKVMTRVQGSEVSKTVALLGIETPRGNVNVTHKSLLRGNESIESTEKQSEQPSPISVLDAASILDTCSPRICRAKDQLDFELRCSIPMLLEHDSSQGNSLTYDVGNVGHSKIFQIDHSPRNAVWLPAGEQDLTNRDDYSAKGELKACSNATRKVMLTEGEQQLYVHKVLMASGFADDVEKSTEQCFSTKKPVSSDLFFVLEDSNSQIGIKPEDEASFKNLSRIHRLALIYRKMLFDCVSDILDSRFGIYGKPQNWPNLFIPLQPQKLSGQEIAYLVFSELQDLRNHPYADVGDMLYSMIENDLKKKDHWQSETWDIVVDIERLIFKQLVEEAIEGLIHTYSRKSGIPELFCRRKLF
ncbi:hypothetical protein O6H91_10G009100 [Diphasiastrum complanatum]|uniref:Uncharacterized protein n=5 Tax=Diphasiastrum complanatum TaxID=34168 RepID=A0ACC2CEH7_DIPCM|nr:hypothetical protein O6H91_10G009100 [Diphasiastrum complanatum]KAJ7540321.1 hypothetical protein O6H91_10G009100 [Diphasiastrum complanatum]KAJ7540322.1 hypothetical protein O6H91_10G009100 [Diphasiastrum complanatum]KAJ7540325.1 hypothetical protein O6H91_10G009100 [Diphasiastrum complanatum]KAJ7540326.1 hypothetical protein O6H91_10G009100 [Diphasiastrum complanatum]